MLDKLPKLKVLAHHMGAMVPYFEGRVGPGWDQLGKRTSDEDLTLVLKRLKKRRTNWLCSIRAMMSPAAKRATNTINPRNVT